MSEPDPLDRMLHALDQIFQITPTTHEDERRAYITALIEVARFLRAEGLRRELLTDLAFALDDLNSGRVAAFLEPRKRPGSPPDGRVLWLKRVRVLGVMYALQKSGMTRETAAKHISTQRPDLKCLMTRGKDLPQAIQRWARELDEAKPGTLLGEYSEQRIEIENEIEIETKKRLGRESLEPSEWRQFADNFLAGIRPNPGI